MPQCQVKLRGPSSVVSTTCNILAKETWPSGGNGEIVVQTAMVGRDGLLNGRIVGWASIDFQIQREELRGFNSFLSLDTTYPSDVLNVFKSIDHELQRTWHCAVKSLGDVSVSGRLLIRSEPQRNGRRIRVYVGEHPQKRFLIDSSSFL